MPVDIRDIEESRPPARGMARKADDQPDRQRERAESRGARRAEFGLHGAIRGRAPERRREGQPVLSRDALHRRDRASAAREICELFNCRQADVRPISGNAANTAIALGWLRGGDTVIVNSTDAGGHISHNLVGVFGRRIQMRGQTLTAGRDNSVRLHFFPLSEDRYRMDAKGAVEMVDRLRPQLVVLGKSLFLFPEPLKELVPVCREHKIPILFDGAHVLGLIAGGEFQDPLREGATYLTGSTHKTFPGPQRGVIFADLEAAEADTYWGPADRGVFPGSSSNHHLHSLPGLLVATREMKRTAARTRARSYATRRRSAARSLPKGSRSRPRTPASRSSHQIAVNVAGFGGGVKVAARLESQDIIVNYNMLPGDQDPRNPSGLRIGVQEMTRFGMTPSARWASSRTLIADAIRGKAVKAAVNRLRGRFVEMRYM